MQHLEIKPRGCPGAAKNQVRHHSSGQGSGGERLAPLWHGAGPVIHASQELLRSQTSSPSPSVQAQPGPFPAPLTERSEATPV